MSCDFAHGQEELLEWIERRDFLRQKLAKAREDMLIMPDDFNFGKYNFLLYDWMDLKKKQEKQTLLAIFFYMYVFYQVKVKYILSFPAFRH